MWIQSFRNLLLVNPSIWSTRFSCEFGRFSSRRLHGAVPVAKRLPPRRSLASYVVLICPGFAFGLGIWQIQRRKEKLRLIEDLKQRLYAEPVTLPENLSELKDMEYRPVIVTGTFDHSREFVISPRMKLETTDRRGGGLASSSDRIGGHVITPFRLKNRDLTILINRGWVPKANLLPKTRMKGQVVGEQTLNGIVRLTEKRPPFVTKNKPEANQWFYRDIEAMANLTGTAPVYLEASSQSSVPGGPTSGQSHVQVRNEHLQYIITWFSLGAITTSMWYWKFVRTKVW